MIAFIKKLNLEPAKELLIELAELAKGDKKTKKKLKTKRIVLDQGD